MNLLNKKWFALSASTVLGKTLLLSTVITSFGLSSAASANVNPFIGEIQIFGGNFCPRGWTETSGQLLPISQFQAVFSLLGTTFGGDGRTTFALPDLRGRIAVGQGFGPGLDNIIVGQRGGVEQVTLTAANMPSHTHTATTVTTVDASSGRGRLPNPDNAVLADDGRDNIYTSAAPDVDMSSEAMTSTTVVGTTGASLPVNNMQPAQVTTVCIALQGTFPSRD